MSPKVFVRKITLFAPLSLSIFFSLVQPANAVQAHGGSEGLITHQVGHILFFIGMIFLLIQQTRIKLTGAGWPEFKVFIWLILCWNCLAFTGHWMNEVMDKGKYIKADGQTIGFQVANIFDFIFYLTRLDHILLVPAFYFLLLALKRWSHKS